MGQLIGRSALVAERQRRRLAGQRLVLTNGVFDLLHVGHLRYLAAARALGDWLIVGINDDASVQQNKGPRRPIVPANERAELVAGLACCDYVTIFGESTADQLILALQPELYVKGGDYRLPGQPAPSTAMERPLPEAPTVLAYGGRVVILPLVPDSSSTGLIERILARYGDRGG